MSLRFDYNNMMSANLGQNGLTDEELHRYILQGENALNLFVEKIGTGMTGWVDVEDENGEVVEDLQKFASQARKDFDYFVVFGIGGSALGAKTIFDTLAPINFNLLPKEKRNAPMVFVEDNIDAEKIESLFNLIDVKKTLFNIVTKSGKTTETLSQFMLAVDNLKSAGVQDLAKHFVFTTDSKDGYLAKIAGDMKVKTFIVPQNVGGRFSVLTPVGFLPAAMIGVDIKSMLLGAKTMKKRSLEIVENPALMKAVLEFAYYHKDKKVNVVMPYSSRLRSYAEWYAQLLAESIGKRFNNKKQFVNVGITPICSVGATDQHSLQQLFVEGPFDKIVTFVSVEKQKSHITIPNENFGIEDLDYLCGKDFESLLPIENESVKYALTKAKKVNNTIVLDELNAFTLGELFMFNMFEIAILGELFDVNAFNQPGVEDGKIATFSLLKKKGFENSVMLPNKDEKYIIP